MTSSSISDVFGRFSVFCALSNRMNGSSSLNFKSGVVAMTSWWPVNKYSCQFNHSLFLILIFFLFAVESSNRSFLHPPLMAPLSRWTLIKVFYEVNYPQDQSTVKLERSVNCPWVSDHYGMSSLFHFSQMWTSEDHHPLHKTALWAGTLMTHY